MYSERSKKKNLDIDAIENGPAKKKEADGINLVVNALRYVFLSIEKNSMNRIFFLFFYLFSL